MAAAERTDDFRTLYITGISYACTKATIEEACSEFGPVRSCFLVQPAGAERHKGCGYVQYAMQADMQRALQGLNGREIGGRPVNVEVARKRARFVERKELKRSSQQADLPAAQPVKKSKSGPVAGLTKQQLVRTVAVGGFPESQKEAVLDVASVYGKVECSRMATLSEIDSFHLGQDSCPDGSVLLITFPKGKDAMNTVAALHRQPLSCLSKATQQASQDRTGPSLWARQASGEGQHWKKWRLILRNLAFNTGEDDIALLLKPAGAVWHLSVPRKPDGACRGFAFAAMACRADAVRAISTANGKKLKGRTVAVDWAVAKADFQLRATTADTPAGAAAGAPDGPESAADVVPEQLEERAVASPVQEGAEGPAAPAAKSKKAKKRQEQPGGEDAAPAKKQKKDRKAAQTEKEGTAEAVTGPQQQAEQAAGLRCEAADEEGTMQAAVIQQLLQGGTAAVAAEAAAPAPKPAAGKGAADSTPQAKTTGVPKAAPAQPAEPEAGLNTTVFVRGLPLDATQDALRAALRVHGPVKSCRYCRTGAAERVLRLQSLRIVQLRLRLVKDKGTGRLKGTAFVDFVRPASADKATQAQPAGSSADGGTVLVGGRSCEVCMALSQDAARSLAAGADTQPKDNRHLYLAKEGAFEEASPAWESMSAGDKARRRHAAAEKAAKLKSPNFCVSPTRLHLANIPKSLDDKALKQLLMTAVKARASKAQPKIKQVKILRDPERRDAEGQPSSRGLAFVEFADHEHALCALRELNNNPSTFSGERRPIVEFAIENALVLHKRSARNARAGKPGPTAAPGGDDQPPAAQAPPASTKRPKAASRAPQPAQAPDGAAAPLSKKERRRQTRAKKQERDAARELATDLDGQEPGQAARPARPKAAERAQAAHGGQQAPASKQAVRQAGKQRTSRPPQPSAGSGQRPGVAQQRGRAERQAVSSPARQQRGHNVGTRGRVDPKQGAVSELAKKSGPQSKPPSDKLDSLVAQYKSKLFGGAEPSKAAVSRWFE